MAMKTKKGFTVVELLITLALLSIIVVLTLRVGESVTANSRITGLINNFLADFSQAKLLASSENRYVAITFSADGRSYTIQKQTDVSDYLTWTLVKTEIPLSDRTFFNSADVSDFAINSTGEVRSLPIDITASPAGVILKFYIRKGGGTPSDGIAYNRTIRIFPSGGLKVEKK
jgi:prepilin-type N-terminal cleavage/methylation domain-containing protein